MENNLSNSVRDNNPVINFVSFEFFRFTFGNLFHDPWLCLGSLVFLFILVSLHVSSFIGVEFRSGFLVLCVKLRTRLGISLWFWLVRSILFLLSLLFYTSDFLSALHSLIKLTWCLWHNAISAVFNLLGFSHSLLDS